MEIDEILDFALSLPDTIECTPFGPDNIVIKTNGKIFIILFLAGEPPTMNYKATPEDIIEQREDYPNYIFPGYHMNKKHWNTLHINRSMPSQVIQALIKTSYSLVRKW